MLGSLIACSNATNPKTPNTWKAPDYIKEEYKASFEKMALVGDLNQVYYTNAATKQGVLFEYTSINSDFLGSFDGLTADGLCKYGYANNNEYNTNLYYVELSVDEYKRYDVRLVIPSLKKTKIKTFESVDKFNEFIDPIIASN